VEVKDMFDKLKKMFEDERAMGACLEIIEMCCTPIVWAECIDTLCCAGFLSAKSCVKVIEEIMKLITG
jgi:hypothetical protein